MVEAEVGASCRRWDGLRTRALARGATTCTPAAGGTVTCSPGRRRTGEGGDGGEGGGRRARGTDNNITKTV